MKGIRDEGIKDKRGKEILKEEEGRGMLMCGAWFRDTAIGVTWG